MKKLYKYLFMVVSAVALLPLMTACSDDESTGPIRCKLCLYLFAGRN